MAWLSGWSYRKEISITGQSGAGTNFQVTFSIGDSAGGDFHLEGHCTNFPQDIEVTDNDGTTLLKFLIKNITADPLEMSVKVADDLDSNQTIYVYYGKSGATTNSNGSDTFISFFDGVSSGWTEVDPNSHIAFANNRLEFTGLTRNEDAYVYQSTSENNNVIIESTLYVTSGDSQSLLMVGAMGDIIDDFANMDNGFGLMQSVDISKCHAWLRIADANYLGTGNIIAVGTTYYTRIVRSGNTVTAYWYTDSARSNLAYSDTKTQATLPTNLGYVYLIDSWNSASALDITGWMDDFRVRKYAATEPAFSSAGSEETPPTGVTMPLFIHHQNQMRA